MITLEDILQQKIVGIRVYPDANSTLVQIVLDLVGDQYDQITALLEDAGFVMIQHDSQVQSWSNR